MSTFSDTGSFLITSGAIQATVPANDIFVLLSLSSLDVPKSEIFTVSLWVTKTLKDAQRENTAKSVYLVKRSVKKGRKKKADKAKIESKMSWPGVKTFRLMMMMIMQKFLQGMSFSFFST